MMQDYYKSKHIMMQINYNTIDAELQSYLPFLNKFMKVEMNQQLTGKQEIAEMVLTTLIGTRNIRQGAAPMVEIQANIMKLPPMEIAFARPTPGIPENMQQSRVYYRTVPLRHSKKNIPFWRARGILKVNKNGDVRYSLIGWGSEDASRVTQGHYTLSNDKGDTVIVSAGTVIED